jgi:hypothetical protein
MQGVHGNNQRFKGIPADVFQMAAVAPDRKAAHKHLRKTYPEMKATFREFDEMANKRSYTLPAGSEMLRTRAVFAQQGWVWSKKMKWWGQAA